MKKIELVVGGKLRLWLRWKCWGRMDMGGLIWRKVCNFVVGGMIMYLLFVECWMIWLSWWLEWKNEEFKKWLWWKCNYYDVNVGSFEISYRDMWVVVVVGKGRIGRKERRKKSFFKRGREERGVGVKIVK